MLLASLAPALGLNFNNDTLNLIGNGDLRANDDFPSFLSECAADVPCATSRGGKLEKVFRVTESSLFGQYPGYWALRFTANGTDDYTLPWWGTATTFAAEQGDTFIFSAYCRTVSGTSDATLFIFNADDTAERTSSRGPCTSDTWTELSVTHTLDSADTTGVKLRFDNDGGKDAVILFDGFFAAIVPQVHVQFFGGNFNCHVPPSLVEHGVDVIVEGREVSHTAHVAHFELGGNVTDNKPELAGYQTGTNFAAVLSAAVPIHTGGAYTFSLTLGNGDTAVVYVDGAVVLSTPCSWGSTHEATVELDAGVHAVRVLFTDDGWHDHVRLQYSGPDTDDAIKHVPRVALSEVEWPAPPSPPSPPSPPLPPPQPPRAPFLSTAAGNLIGNGDLATGDFPSFLSECAANVPCATSRGGELEMVSGASSFNAGHALRFTANGNDDYTLPWFGTATVFDAEQGDTFIFSAYCRTVSGTSDATLFIFNAEEKAERTSSRGPCTSDTWTELSVTHAVDAAGATGVKLRFDNDGGKDAVILFDAFTLVRQATCPDVCTGDSIETCFYDPACSDVTHPDYNGGLGCNAGGRNWNCRFCGFTNDGDVEYLPCPALCPNVCTGNPSETCFYDPTCNDAGAGWEGGLGCNAGGRAQECRFCGFTDGGGNTFIDCPVCDLDAIAAGAGGAHTCGERIEYLKNDHGISEEWARDAVAAEFPVECGACRITQFPAPIPSCDEDAMAGAYSCRARIDYVMKYDGLSAAAAGAKVATEYDECGGCEYWYLSHETMWVGLGGAAAVVLLGAAGLVARNKSLRSKKAQPSATEGPELRRPLTPPEARPPTKDTMGELNIAMSEHI